MLSVLIYGIASAAQATETRAGWGTEEVHSYIRSLLKVMRRDNIDILTFQNLFLFTFIGSLYEISNKNTVTVSWKHCISIFMCFINHYYQRTFKLQSTHELK